jgi:hypothetical protein
VFNYLRPLRFVTPHALYVSMGIDRAERESAYPRWLSEGVPEDELARIRRSLTQERSLGDERFQRWWSGP